MLRDMVRSRRQGRTGDLHRGFTLIEILVVVAIIALLISILLPSLRAAREQARRTVCAANLNQQHVGLRSYSIDYKGYLPWRGWFSYTISETQREAYGTGSNTTKTLVNLAMIMGKHLGMSKTPNRQSVLGKEWDILYCPSTREQHSKASGGLPSLWDPGYSHTYGGYNYALPMAKRTGAPKLDGDVYPRDPNKLEAKWVNLLTEKAQGGDPMKLMPRSISVLVTDFVIGGAEPPHRNAFNAAFSDGHVNFVNYPKAMKGLGSASDASFELWFYAMLRP